MNTEANASAALVPPPHEAGPTTHLRQPAERCYWAVLEVPARTMKHPGLLPVGLLADIENEVPVPLDDLQIIGAPAGDRHVLVCAVPKVELESIDPSAVSLVPEHVPPELGVNVDPESLNLLVGAFRSPVLQAASRSRHMLLAATFTLCALCVSVGMHRRADHAHLRAAEHAQQVETALATLLPAASDRRDANLVMALEQARELSTLVRRARPLRDAALDMESILAAWPTAVAHAKPHNLSVTAEGMHLAVTVEGDSTSFLHAFKAPPMFTLEEPRLAAVGPLTRLNLRMRPTAGNTPSERRGTP